MTSYYVEVCDMENTDLGPEVRFPERLDAEEALNILLAFRETKGGLPEVFESDHEPNTTFVEWCETDWS